MDDFRKEVMRVLETKLGDEYQLFPIDNIKNNELLVHGICIQKKDEYIGAIVYVDKYFLYYAAKIKTLEKIADELIQECQIESIPPTLGYEMENFERIQDKVRVRLINYAANSVMLKNFPYRNFLDLAITYYLDMDIEVMGQNAAVLITNGRMKRWNVTEEDLYKIGMKNLHTREKCIVIDLPNLVRKLAREEKEEKVRDIFCNIEKEGIPNVEMYVASTSKKLFGAACMLNIPFLQEISDSLKCDLIIYPSNVNRLVIVPIRKGNKDRITTEDVQQVNMDSVPKVNWLSNSIYMYDRTKQEVTIYKEGVPL